jgi:tetratricopeptide (TPR) repeat protein
MQGTAEAIRREPGNPQRLFDHAQNVFWIGEIARDRGQINQAEAAYREYKKLGDQMVAIEPDNLRWRMEPLYAEENIGIVLLSKRRFAEAARQFEGAVRPMESLAAVDSANKGYQKELSNVLAWLAQARWAMGEMDAAIAIRQRQVAFIRELLANGNTDVGLRYQLIPAYQSLGLLYASRGQAGRGVEPLRLAVAEANRLIPIEPDNMLWKGLAAQAQFELARALLSMGQISQATTETQGACGLAEQVHAHDPDATWRHLITDCYGLRSRLSLQSADPTQALRLAEQALASARTERRPDATSIKYRVAAAYRQIGDIHRRMGDDEAAKAAWGSAFAQLPGNIPEKPAEMSERAEILKRLGKSEEARPIADKLGEIGYRRTT